MNSITAQTQFHRKDFDDNYASVSWTILWESFQSDWGRCDQMCRLIDAICNSYLKSHLFAAHHFNNGLGRLGDGNRGFYLFNRTPVNWYRDCLAIGYDTRTDLFHLEYVEDDLTEQRWKKTCPSDEAFSALIHFFVLKKWLEIPLEEIPRGSWTL